MKTFRAKKVIEPAPMLILVVCGALGILLAGCTTPSPSAPPAAVPTVVIPTLISPPANATMPNGRYDRSVAIRWDFRWSDVPGATEYHLFVKHLPSRLALIDQDRIVTSSYHHVGAGSYIVPKNLSSWTWKVRAKVNGQWQAWSEPRIFNVTPPDTAPRG